MPKKKTTLADSIRSDIEIAKNRAAEAQEKFDLWSERLTTAQQEIDRLESALAALEGVAPSPRVFTAKPYQDVKMPLVDAVSIDSRRGKGQINLTDARDELVPAASPVATKPNRVMFNGEEIELEAGFRVGKNSFGEDVLIPDGMPDLPPMEEPLSVRKPDFSLPAVGSGDRFTDPKDLF